MNIHRNGVVLAGFVFLAALRVDAQTWEPLGPSNGAGGVSASTQGSYWPSVAFDGNGIAAIAWVSDYNGGANMDVYFRQWDPASGAWMERSGSASGAGVSGDVADIAQHPSLAFDGSGTPFIAWEDLVGSTKTIYCMKWTPGAGWTGPGGAGTETAGVAGNSQMYCQASIAIDAAGHPWVAWKRQILGIPQAALKRWDGAAWTEVAGSASGGAVSGLPAGESADEPSMTLDAGGIPHVTYVRVDAQANRRICVRRFDGTAWAGLSGSDTGIDLHQKGRSPALAVSPSSAVVAAWEDVPPGGTISRIFVRQWNGSAWTTLGGPLGDATTSATQAALALDVLGRPFVAWQQDSGSAAPIVFRLPGMRWTGTQWTGLGGSDTTIGGTSPRHPTCAIDASGTIGVAWGDSSDNDIHFLRWANPGAAILGLEQRKLTAPLEVVPPGFVTGTLDDGIRIEAVGAHPEGYPFSMEVQVKPVGPPFSAADPGLTFTSAPGVSTVAVDLTGLTYGVEYQWRIRCADAGGILSSWVYFNGSNPAHRDFWLRDNTAPTASSGGTLLDPETMAIIATGASASSLIGVLVQCAGSDHDSDRFKLVAECRPLTDPLVGTPTSMGALVSSGAVATVLLDPAEGRNHLQYMLVDEFELGGAWIPAGEFVFLPRGSSGVVTACGQSGAPGVLKVTAFLSLLLLVRRRV